MKGALASLYCELDRSDEARELLDEATARGLVGLPRDRLLMTTLGHWAEVVCAPGATDVAAIIYDEFAPYAKLFVPPTYGMPEGPVASHLGMLATVMGSFDAAVDHFTSADAACRNLGAGTGSRQPDGSSALAPRGDEPGDADRACRLSRGGCRDRGPRGVPPRQASRGRPARTPVELNRRPREARPPSVTADIRPFRRGRRGVAGKRAATVRIAIHTGVGSCATATHFGSAVWLALRRRVRRSRHAHNVRT